MMSFSQIPLILLILRMLLLIITRAILLKTSYSLFPQETSLIRFLFQVECSMQRILNRYQVYMLAFTLILMIQSLQMFLLSASQEPTRAVISLFAVWPPGNIGYLH